MPKQKKSKGCCLIMKKTKINNLLEYLTPSFILSYFVFHNISLVLIGIIFSLYLINVDFIISLSKSINNTLIKKNVSRYFNKFEKVKDSDVLSYKSGEVDSKLSLVEIIEELGYIPSISNKNDSNAA